MKKKILIIVGVIVIITLIIILNLSQKKHGAEVEIELVTKGDIVSKVEANGELKAKGQIDISAETIGRIKKIYYKEGNFVKKGVLIIELDDLQAAASRKVAEAQLQQAKQAFERGQSLIEKDLISKESFEQIKLNYDIAEAKYEQALDAYEKTKIYAPISGRIMKINIEEGETAVMGTMNYQGTVLATIADLSSMLAIVKIDETDVPQVKVGQAAEVIPDALPDSTFAGVVTKVGLMPIATTQLSTEKTTDFEVEIEMKNFSHLLRPGMNVNTSIITSQKTNVLKVPIQAIGSRKIEDTLKQTAFLVQNGKARLNKVIIGAASDNEIEILDGISEGDTVVIGPYRILSKLKDGEGIRYKVSKEKNKQPSE